MEEMLIEKVRQRTFLHDTKSPDYRYQHMRANAWEGIGKELKIKRKFYVFTCMCDGTSRDVRLVCSRPNAYACMTDGISHACRHRWEQVCAHGIHSFSHARWEGMRNLCRSSIRVVIRSCRMWTETDIVREIFIEFSITKFRGNHLSRSRLLILSESQYVAATTPTILKPYWLLYIPTGLTLKTLHIFPRNLGFVRFLQ